MNIDVVLDTNVVLYLLRANERWLRIVEELHPRVVGVSAMTFMEVEMGIMTESEQNVSDRFFSEAVIIPVHESIARTATMFLRERSRSLRSPHLADAIIAATAAELGIPILTNNPKDFKRFPGVKAISA
ncbi:MAG: PIN domain-containing protein [Patescibacteria group bacterium]